MSDEVLEMIIDARDLFSKGKYVDASDLYKKAYRKGRDSFSDENKEEFAVAIYEVDVRDNGSYENIEAPVQFITSIVSQKDTTDGQFCPYTESVITIMKLCKKNKDKTLFWSEKLDPLLLNPYTEHNNHYSYRETWYSNTTKALLSDKNYNECLKISNDALKNIKGIMNNDEYWFKYRIAICHRELGHYDEAISMFEEVLEYKDIWSNRYELAETYYFMDDYDNALKESCHAALTNSKVILDKVRLYELIELILMEKELFEDAQDVAFLIHSIRLNDNSSMRYDEEAFELEEAGYDISEIDYVTIEKGLRNTWLKFLED